MKIKEFMTVLWEVNPPLTGILLSTSSSTSITSSQNHKVVTDCSGWKTMMDVNTSLLIMKTPIKIRFHHGVTKRLM